MLGQLPLNIRLDAELSLENFWFAPQLAPLQAELGSPAEPAIGSVFLWGSAGAGKSHLLQALAAKNGAGARYLPLADLLDFSPPAVLEGVEGASAVLMDDVHLLAEHRDWQEAVFHCFNTLKERGIPQVYSAHAPPAQLTDTLPDLRSRWGGLAVYQLPPHDDAALGSLLRFRGARRGLDFSDEVIAYILARSPRTAVGLMALLDTIDQAALARGRAITIPLLAELKLWSGDL